MNLYNMSSITLWTGANNLRSLLRLLFAHLLLFLPLLLHSLLLYFMLSRSLCLLLLADKVLLLLIAGYAYPWKFARSLDMCTLSLLTYTRNGNCLSQNMSSSIGCNPLMLISNPHRLVVAAIVSA